MPGSMITITACTFTILTMYGMGHSYLLMLRYMAILGIAMVAAPGAPGGAIMSALPFLPVVGIPSEGELASLLMTLYLTQDSFGTAANISGDTAISVARLCEPSFCLRNFFRYFDNEHELLFIELKMRMIYNVKVKHMFKG